jgi:hypothetical protein
MPLLLFSMLVTMLIYLQCNSGGLLPAERMKESQQVQGHQVCRLLMEQVGHIDCGHDLKFRPCRFQASRYSFLHSSRSSAESLNHCLVSRNVRAGH